MTVAQPQEPQHRGNQPSAQSGQAPGGAQQNRDLQRSQGGQQGQAGQQGRRETTGQAPGSNAGGSQSSEERRTGQAGERKGQSTREQTTGQNERGQNERNVRGQRGERETTGQNERNERNTRGDRERSTTGQAGERRENVERDRTQTDRDRVQGQSNQNRTTVQGREGGRSNVNVQLSQEQRTRIHDVIIKERSAPRVANVDFSLDVGVRVPRTIRLVRVPTSIVEIEPAWRGFEYFLVGDEIVIVDPGTLEIVAVIPA
jgi:hypothetical protein